MPSAAISIIQGHPLGLATAAASVVVGLEARPIQVEVCSSRGPSFFQLVGLAEAAVREARVRVASALAGLDVLLDEYAVTVNLAPADLRKAGATLDLAIALGLLAALGRLPARALEDTLLLGELGLDGSLRPVRGLLPQLDGARQRGLLRAIVPAPNGREAGIAQGLDVRLASTLADAVEHLSQRRPLPSAPCIEFVPSTVTTRSDLADVRGQASARRALEIAAAGAHNLLFIGPPGSGDPGDTGREPEVSLSLVAAFAGFGAITTRSPIGSERPEASESSARSSRKETTSLRASSARTRRS
jgi:magnesium chelatase family protein